MEVSLMHVVVPLMFNYVSLMYIVVPFMFIMFIRVNILVKSTGYKQT